MIVTQQGPMHAEIRFKRDDILTLEMLRQLYGFPRNLLEIWLGSCQDGIALGFDFFERGKSIYLSPGVVRFDGQNYILAESVCLTEIITEAKRQLGAGDKDYTLCLQGGDEIVSGGVGLAELKFTVLQDREASGASLPLAVFTTGAQNSLPDPQSANPAEEFTKRSNLRILAMPCLCAGESTFAPLVFRAVAALLRKKTARGPMDHALLYILQQHGLAPMPTVRDYIHSWDEEVPADREEIFKLLCQCAGRIPKSVPIAVDVPAKETSRQSKPPLPTFLNVHHNNDLP